MRTQDSPTKRIIGSRLRRLVSFCVGLSLAAVTAQAQQITGVPGSLSATTTIDGKQLPPPPPEFGRVIKETYENSKPWWPPRVVPPGRTECAADHDR